VAVRGSALMLTAAMPAPHRICPVRVPGDRPLAGLLFLSGLERGCRLPGWLCNDAGVVQVPLAVARAAAAFGLDAGSLRALGGNSGSAGGAGYRMLRVGRPEVIDAELAASSAVAAVVPVPAVLDRADAGDASAVLLEMLPGQPMAQFARRRPELARAAGQACGTVHALLAGVPAPAGLRAVPGPDRGTPTGRPRVLHLDLHPLNILAGAGGEVTGVLDWANAAAGDPDLDRARTWTILTLDPAARARRGEPGWAALCQGWIQSGRLHDVPAAHRAWACAFMLSDLAGRYTGHELQHITDALDEAKTASGNPA
jgi:Phosphotransferase enzyme family